MSAYISYKVTVEYARPPTGVTQTSFTVIRRFSDFVWLREQLHTAFPYMLVPALPEKQAIGRLNVDFVDTRHRALQRFVDRLAAHPDLSQCDPLTKFLTLPDAQFTAMRDAQRSASAVVSSAAAAAGSGVMRFLRATGTAISYAVDSAKGSGTGAAGAAGGPGVGGVSGSGGKSAEDLSFEELEAYLTHQAPLLALLYTAAAESAVKHREDAQALLDYGAALRALGTSEGGGLGTSLTAVYLSTWAASTAAYEQAVQESELWVERLGDTVRGVRAVQEMMGERQRASAALSEALSVVERLRAHITALQASPSPSAATEKGKAEAELTTAQTAVTEARAYYDKVAASVIAETERYRASLNRDFRSMLLDYVAAQQRTQAKLAAAWDKAVPECTGAVTVEGATPLPTGAGIAGALAAATMASGGAGASGVPVGDVYGTAGGSLDPTASPATATGPAAAVGGGGAVPAPSGSPMAASTPSASANPYDSMFT